MRFPDSARVCFVGDSITAANTYIAKITAFYKENFSDKNISIYNCGVAGGSAETQLTFFESDTAYHNPTHIFIMLGVNDSWRDRLAGARSPERYNILKERYELYKVNLAKLCERSLKCGAKVTLLTPPPYAEYIDSETPAFKGGYALIQSYAEHVKNYGREMGFDVWDVHGYLTEIMQQENIYNADRVHPTERGHYYIAKFLLECQGFDLPEDKPLPSFMDEWCELNKTLRDIYFTELVIIGHTNFSLGTEEKIERVRKYYDNTVNGTGLFCDRAKTYLEYKIKEKEIADRIVKLMDVELNNRF